MRLTATFRSDWTEMRSRTVAMIAASGYEARARQVTTNLWDGLGTRIAIGFAEHAQAPERRVNDEAFLNNDFRLVVSPGSDVAVIEAEMGALIRQMILRSGALAVDISSMTRAWYGAVVRFLISLSDEGPIEVFFIYYPRDWAPLPGEVAPNEIVAPVPGFGSMAPPDLPLCLVVGVGHEGERGVGLLEVLDPRMTVVMIARGDGRYLEASRIGNAELLERVDPRWVFEYPLTDPVAALRMLESICAGLLDRYRVVLVSLGPKLFGLYCFLLAGQRHDLSVWRVSPGKKHPPTNVKAVAEDVVIVRTVWERSGDLIREIGREQTLGSR